MTLRPRLATLSLFATLGLGVACSSSSNDGQDTSTGGQSAISAAGATANGAAGATSAAGQSATGTAGVTGNGSGGSSGAAGSSAAAGSETTGGTGGAAAGGDGGAGGEQAAGGDGGAGGASSSPPAGPFTCTEYIGAYLTMEWYEQHNFESKLEALGGDGDKWQLKWHHHGYVNTWNDPNSVFWENDGDPMDDGKGAPIQSPCASGSDAPDRIVILVIDWEMLTEDAWVESMNKLIDTIKVKRPNAKRIDLMPLPRCPNNMMCNANEAYGPGANDSAGPQDCYVPPYVDSAFAKVVAERSDIAALAPVLEGTACNNNGAHLNGDDNEMFAQEMATTYSTDQ